MQYIQVQANIYIYIYIYVRTHILNIGVHLSPFCLSPLASMNG